LAKTSIINLSNVKKSFYERYNDIVWEISDILSDDPIKGWLNNYKVSKKIDSSKLSPLDRVQNDSNNLSSKKEKNAREEKLKEQIHEMIQDSESLELLIQKITDDTKNVWQFLNESNYSCNMKDMIIVDKNANLKSQTNSKLST